jgi:hypothetical protein
MRCRSQALLFYNLRKYGEVRVIIFEIRLQPRLVWSGLKALAARKKLSEEHLNFQGRCYAEKQPIQAY